jgi:hypothetical protein
VRLSRAPRRLDIHDVEILSCAVTPSASAHGPRLDFIRSASATPLVSGALNPQTESSSSSLTGTNVPLLTSPQLHTRKVAGSIPAGTTSISAGSGLFLSNALRACQIRAKCP